MMQCQPRRWLWGLLPLAALWLLAGLLTHDGIQVDLTQRSAAEALKAKAPWATASFDGRDATVNGVAPEPEAQGAARAAVAGVDGVRLVRDTTTVLAEAKPYLWSATRDGAKVTLAGSVPSEEARARLLAETRAAVPGATVVDEMKVARGAPAVFAAASGYALSQLARLPDGKAQLTDASLSLTGTAPSAELYQAATAAALPQGVAGAATINLPLAKPYLWSAEKQGGAITLTGNVPSNDARATLLAAAAKAATPGAAVNDRMTLAAGSPTGFEAMAAAALGHLAGLDRGTASLSDAAYRIAGGAPSYPAYLKATEAARSLPQGFSLAGVDVTAPTVSPYLWSATRDAAGLTLAGNVPSEEVRAANLAAARAAASGLAVTDRQEVNLGAPASFAAMASQAIAQLGRLNAGVASLSDTAFSIAGQAPTMAARGELIESLKALPAGFTLSRQDVAAAPVSPYRWAATREGSTVTLSGLVPDETTKAANAAAARAAIPGATVEDRQELAAGAPNGFANAAAFAIGRLAQLDQGEAGLTDTTLAITGRTATLAGRNAAVAGLGAVPAGFAVTRQEIVAPRITPYDWSATRTGQTLTLSGYVPDEATKAANLAAAGAAAGGASVVDQQVLGAGAPEGFSGMAAQALQHLGRLESGTASLTNSAYSITGRAPTAAIRDNLVAGLLRLPPGFLLARQDIAAPLPPPPPAPVTPPPPPTPPPAPPAAAAPRPETPPPVAVVAPAAPPPVAAPPPIPPAPPAAAAPPPPAPPAIVPPPPPPSVAEVPPPAPVTVPLPPPPPLPVVDAPPPPAAAPLAPSPSLPPPAVAACQSRLDGLLGEPVLFDFAEATIRPVSYLLLGRLADAAKQCPDRLIEIGAHTDSDGAPDRNQALSERRAQAVVDFLVREGVAASALKAIGYGQSKPIAPNDTPENKQKNRRVEFTVR